MTSLLPITALVAIVVFITKEVLEAVRRYRGDARKLTAIKALLAEECEKNSWGIKSLRTLLKSLDGDWETHTVSITKTPQGKYQVKTVQKSDEDASWGVTRIHEIYNSVFSKHILDIATLDKELFAISSETYESIAEAIHVRDSLIDYLQDPNADAFISGFFSYGVRELDDAEEKIKKLYVSCTGRELMSHKLRSFT